MDKTSSKPYTSPILNYTLISMYCNLLLVKTHSNMNHDFKKTDTKESDYHYILTMKWRIINILCY